MGLLNQDMMLIVEIYYMSRKAKTMQLQGNDYAKVSERIKEFRADCPRGDISTEPTLSEDDTVMFKATVIKDLAEEHSPRATGHSMGKNNGTKAFEKLESIAVGRALALLGYAADGEIATAEEMEEFEKYQEEKEQQYQEEVTEFTKAIGATETLEQLKDLFTQADPKIKANPIVINAKDVKKGDFDERN